MNPRYIKSIARVVSVIMLLALLAGLTPGAVLPAYAAPGDITRVSVDSSGAQANGGSIRGQLSADGRYVAFVSDATNLIPDDTNNAEDVFVKDRQTGATTRVSVASQTGAQANNGSGVAAISSDGRYVAFYSDASNLVSGDTNGIGDIFVRDRQTGLTTRVSVDSSGHEANGRKLRLLSGDLRRWALCSLSLRSNQPGQWGYEQCERYLRTRPPDQPNQARLGCFERSRSECEAPSRWTYPMMDAT